MATVLTAGDIAIIHYNSTGSDAFSFVFLHAVEAGTSVNFTDNGWQALGGFRPGEGTVTYTAPAAIAAGTIVTLTGLDLDEAGDQIIAYQGTEASPTILHVVDLADGNTTVAGDATDANTTALPPGFTLGVNAVALALNNSIYAGPVEGTPDELFAAISNSANWVGSDTIPQIQLPEPFKSQERPAIDLDANDSTHGGRDYQTVVASGGLSVSVADADIAIGDADGTEITRAEITVKSAAAGDLLTVNGLLPAGIVATAYDPATGLLRLTGTASHADYETAIRQVEFSTTEASGAHKQIEVTVFDGQDWSSEAKAFITVAGLVAGPTNNTAPPVLDLDANNSNGGGADYTATFTSGGPAIPVADIDDFITDPDSTTIQSATITIGINRQPDDLLSIAGALPGGITASSYDPSTGVITLSGAASFADYQTALRQVVYSSPNPTPFTGDRVIDVIVNDGVLDSNIATTYMHVAGAPPNVPPVLNLDADSSTTGGTDYLTTFTGSAVDIVDTDVSILDTDSPSLVAATITLTNPHAGDSLTVDTPPLPAGIAASVYDPVTGVLTLTGTASLADYQVALQQIVFNTTDPSTETRIIDVVVNDGTAASNIAHAIVEVVEVNANAPTVDLDGDNSTLPGTSYRTTFTENDPPVAIADTDTLVGDPDLGSTDIASATITLKNAEAGDTLAVSGALPGGITASAYDPATGILTLSGVASFADYETALEAIRFSSPGDTPVAGHRIIQVVVNDGVNDSLPATSLVTVVALDDAPSFAVATNATFQENGAAVVPSPAITLTDADDTVLNGALVRITDGSFPGDGDTLTVNGAISGTVDGINFLWNPTLHALAFTGASSVANYRALLQQVEFQSSSDNPTDFNASPQRTLTWSVTDGAAVKTATMTLDVIAVNDAPQVSVAATATYTENGPPPTVSPAATVSDVDDIDLIAGVVRIASGAFVGDVLSVNGLQSGTFSGIDFSYDPGLHSLLFTHPTSVADYRAFLQAVQFQSTSDDPTNLGLNPTRTLSWPVFDGDAISSFQSTEITINAIDDEPTLIATGQNPTFTGGGGAVDIYSAVTNSTVEFGQTFTSMTLTVTNVTDGTDEILLFDGSDVALTNGNSVAGTATNGLTVNVSVTGSTATVSFSGADLNTAQLQMLVDAMTYSNTSQNPTDANRVITITQLVELLGSNTSPNDNTAALNLVSTVHVNAITADAHCDFDGDSTSDIIWQGDDGTASMWLMDGTTATFVNAVGPFNPGPTWEIKATGDFNGDGKDDIIWQGDDGTASMWLMDGTTATFVNAVGPFNPGPTWEIKATGDFNGDGKDDIIWQGDDGTASMWLMDGTTATFVNAVGPFNPGPTWEIKGTGDFNGDGKDDIIWQGDDGTASMWLMDGTTATFVGAVGPFNPGPTWHIKGTGDFNGDGKSDIVWQGDDGTASMWLMDGTTATFVGPVGPFNPGPGWQIKGTGEFNGDGKSDIHWQSDDGTASIWLVDGTIATVVGAVGPFNPGATWDMIA